MTVVLKKRSCRFIMETKLTYKIEDSDILNKRVIELDGKKCIRIV